MFMCILPELIQILFIVDETDTWEDDRDVILRTMKPFMMFYILSEFVKIAFIV